MFSRTMSMSTHTLKLYAGNVSCEGVHHDCLYFFIRLKGFFFLSQHDTHRCFFKHSQLLSV